MLSDLKKIGFLRHTLSKISRIWIGEVKQFLCDSRMRVSDSLPRRITINVKVRINSSDIPRELANIGNNRRAQSETILPDESHLFRWTETVCVRAVISFLMVIERNCAMSDFGKPASGGTCVLGLTRPSCRRHLLFFCSLGRVLVRDLPLSSLLPFDEGP
jgi:hypothetical protein